MNEVREVVSHCGSSGDAFGKEIQIKILEIIAYLLCLP